MVKNLLNEKASASLEVALVIPGLIVLITVLLLFFVLSTKIPEAQKRSCMDNIREIDSIKRKADMINGLFE